MAGHTPFKVLRDQLAAKVGEDHLAERQRRALEEYERHITAEDAEHRRAAAQVSSLADGPPDGCRSS